MLRSIIATESTVSAVALVHCLTGWPLNALGEAPDRHAGEDRALLPAIELLTSGPLVLSGAVPFYLDGNGTAKHFARSEMADKMRNIRERARHMGLRLLTADEVVDEVRSRRGEIG